MLRASRGSDGKSACHAGDPDWIPGSGRALGGGHDTHPVFLPREFVDRGAPWGPQKSRILSRTCTFHFKGMLKIKRTREKMAEIPTVSIEG